MSKNETGLCQCGCGQPAPIAAYSYAKMGWVKGQPKRFISGHNGRIHSPVDENTPVTLSSGSTGSGDGTTRQIPLTQGAYAIVDSDVYEELAQFEWYLCASSRSASYAARDVPTISGGRITILMHRQILGVGKGMKADHRDGNGLNNTRANLRPCTNQQNLFNRGPQKNNTSGYKGVSWREHANAWEARIHVDRKAMFLGYFKTKEEAARAYDDAAKELHGEFAWLNFPQSDKTANSRMNKCTRCKGYGTIYQTTGQPILCPVCKGSGNVKRPIVELVPDDERVTTA